MYGCGNWTIKKAEHWRNDTFELWCWRRLSRVPWTARRSNQQILKEINLWIFTGRTDAEAEAPMLWPPYVKIQLIRPWGWERRRRGSNSMRRLDSITNSMDMNVSKLQKTKRRSLVCCSPWCGKELDMTQWLNNNKTKPQLIYINQFL